MKTFYLLLLALVLASCTTTKYVDKIVEVPKVETVYETKVQKDSVYLKDSVYIHQKGDTVWSERWHTKFVERLRVDTFLKRDSVHVPVEVRTEVVKNLTAEEKLKVAIGFFLLGLVAGCGGTIWLDITKRNERITK